MNNFANLRFNPISHIIVKIEFWIYNSVFDNKICS